MTTIHVRHAHGVCTCASVMTWKIAINHKSFIVRVSHKTCEDLHESEDESKEEAAEAAEAVEKPPSKKYKRSFCPLWKDKFLWLQYKDVSTCTVYVNKVIIQYSNYSVVSFPHYSSSTVVLTVISILVNSTPQ